MLLPLSDGLTRTGMCSPNTPSAPHPALVPAAERNSGQRHRELAPGKEERERERERIGVDMSLYVIQKTWRGKKAVKAAVELHLFALILLTVGAAVLLLAEPAPPTAHVLYVSLSAYATAILCVAADRAIGYSSGLNPLEVVSSD
ncbi:hypothetical protein ACFS7Z_20900 [Pontibacter toksunensis]|uniref:Uncharacterized protein n=1 Tax=Pontibacter toksunensis TaxID=1332631 RepID=A0ABW6BYF7_9BACT